MPDTLSPPRRRTRLFAVAEVRWATAALLLFLVALPLHLAGAPTPLWATLYAAVYVTGGWDPAWAGLQALREKTLDVDLLMIVAALGAAAIGQVMDGALLIVIFATSGALEAVATARTQDSIRGLLDLTPATATVLDAEGGERTMPAKELRIGDVILVRPGELIAADGVVTGGASDVDQAGITGEPLPAYKSTGDEVFAGTLNTTGTLRVEVGRDPQDSVIARIVALVEQASQTKAPTQLFIEKVEQRYSIGMVTVTVAVFAVPLLFGADLTDALLRAMTFMIVASPCAIVLSTMPPLLSAIANAGRHGVLVKSAVVMEQLGHVDQVAFDKTGTLTEGSPAVSEVEAAAGPDLPTRAQVLAWAAAVEHLSEHPLARAIVDAAGSPAPAEDFSSVPGRGVEGVVEGVRTAVVSPSAVTAILPASLGMTVRRLEAAGRTVVIVLRDGAAVGAIGLTDRVRHDAPAAVQSLAELTAAPPVLLTGDNQAAATQLAAVVGIADVRAGLLPEDKVHAIAAAQVAGHRVLAVGDGVNDAPALATAHAGVAMGGGGSDLTLDAADAVVVRDNLAAIPAAVRLSRRARRVVLQNLVIAAVFIGGLVLWDLIGTLPLPLGVLGHEGSTVIVGLNSLRLLREREWSAPDPR
ncbi:heavy metal translocating P-type ATPase [Flexivirga sp. ID2601S]|uniref:Heavy metal translocating P-type ATPase n=2 Tax=Flexivirga aerilata TaxID=1656889 RepID=A0A849ALD0_9MICO|nr:heavy metal translocating P-type ATPase [Flexivirga aerilata]NNG40151.1 heavy metal translocating P-type ATPase [Flexivirga aerilata]